MISTTVTYVAKVFQFFRERHTLFSIFYLFVQNDFLNFAILEKFDGTFCFVHIMRRHKVVICKVASGLLFLTSHVYFYSFGACLMHLIQFNV